MKGFCERLIDQRRASVGVQAVAAMTRLPPLRQVDANDTTIEGYTPRPDGPFGNVDYYQTVTTGYVEAMGIPLVKSRPFQRTDVAGATVMMNQTPARTFYRDRSPIGRRVKPSGPPIANIPWYTIIGVLKDVMQGRVDKKTGTERYFSFEQRAGAAPVHNPGTMNTSCGRRFRRSRSRGRFGRPSRRSIGRCRW